MNMNSLLALHPLVQICEVMAQKAIVVTLTQRLQNVESSING